ncbi:methyl-CpG-binding domain protein 5 [Trichonephila inaurata madagascariensis]|uniref:Methyl-CpG-binding domain protein 5 n=1 Tax=Trichonephila inaurata madagascariensis TaxID=2747483 RepID=A0A8X6JLD0_9ARAC|nr:methyl-CpG-binding domain protein 5 [Trichonephila inaurata madagascariensis]
MASFSQDARTNTIVLNAPFQAPENLAIASSFGIHTIAKPSTSVEQSTANAVNITFSTESVKQLSVVPQTINMCAPGPEQGPDPTKFAGSYNCVTYPSAASQVNTLPPCDKKVFSGVQKFQEMNPVLSVQHSETFITVPFGWKRVISSGKVIYISPSEMYLYSLQEVAVYLQTEGTCKCGLECPLMLNKVFNFNPMATTKCWNVNDLSWNDPTKLCNHKRKIAAMATFHNSTIPLSSLSTIRESGSIVTQPPAKKEACLTSKRKRLKGKNRSPFDSVLVSQLLAQRDKLGQKKEKPGANKTCYLDGSSQQMKIQNTLKSETLPHSQSLEQRKGSSKPMGFILEEQNLPVLNKLNPAANFNNLHHLNQNFFVPENAFQDKKIQGCLQPFQQQCTPDSNTPSVMFHKHMSPSLPCLLQDQVVTRNTETVYTDRVPPLSSIDHQAYGQTIQQGMFNPQQFLHSNSIPANITLNCNFSATNVSGQVFSTSLPVNQCIDMNSHTQTTADVVTAVSQSSTTGAFLFPTDLQNPTGQHISGNIMSNLMNPNCGQSFNTSTPQDTQQPLSSVAVNSPRQIPSRDDPPTTSRQKSKKNSKAKTNKLNSVLDRGSPCPNIDVRQIPSEHHRPPPEAFATITSSSVGPMQNSNYQAITGTNMPFPPELAFNYIRQPTFRTQSHNGTFFDANKMPDSTVSNNNSPFPVCQNANKNLQSNSFQYQDSNQFPVTSSYPTFENDQSKMKSQTITSKPSLSNHQISSNQIQTVTSTSRQNSKTNFHENPPVEPLTSQNADDSSCSSSKSQLTLDSKLPDVSSSVYTPVSNIGSTTSTSTVLSVAPSNSSPNTVNVLSNANSFFNSSSQSNVINLPVSHTTPQSHINNISTVYSNQGLSPTSHQMRQSIAVTQQPIVFNSALQNSGNHRHDQPTNFFMQNPNTGSLEGMAGLRPSLVQQDNSNMLVQQVLSQKITSDYSATNIFSSTARAQVVQQVGGMVLPASAANSGVNSQQLVLAPAQMRMSGSGGLITMLPPTMTSNGMMNGTQVLAASAQQIGPQMVLSDSIRPNIVNQQQILPNNCFIMSNQPTFVTRPPNSNIVSSQVPCPTSVSLTFTNGTYGTSHNNAPVLAAPVINKTQDRNDINAQQISNEISIQNSKDNSFPAGVHVLHSTQQRLIGQKMDSSEIVQDSWFQKSDFKNNTNEGVNQVTGTFLSNVSTSRSNSVPSNITGHAMISNCGQVLINGDSNCVHPQTVGASNISRMTNVIPIVGGQCALNSPMPPLSVPNVTAVTTTMTQMIPAIGIAPQILGQPVQPMVQVINTVPFNSMQNAVLVPGGSNVLSQTVRLDTLQTSPVVGTPAPTVFNGVVLPPSSVSYVPSQTSNLRPSHPGSHNEEIRMTFENMLDSRTGSNSSCSTPASSCSSTPVSSSSDTHNITYRALSPAIRKRSRDGKRKANSQTVASMLQHGTHNLSLTNTPNSNAASQHQHIQQQQQQHQQQQNAAQLSSLQQQFLQQPMLQTLTVLPQQPRPLLQQPVMNYNSIGSVGGHQILTTGITSPLGIVQPLSMLGVTPTGTVIQNIPVQQVVPGPHFQSLTVLQGPHTVNSLPQEQPVVVNDTSSMGVHPTQMHSAFAAGSIVPNMVATNPMINTHVAGTEVLVTATSQSHAVTENANQSSIPTQFSSIFQQSIPPVAQSLSSTTCSGSVKVCRSGGMNTTSFQVSASSSYQPTSVCVTVGSEMKGENSTSKTNFFFPEQSQKARSIGVQSSCTEHNASVQTVTSTVPVNNSILVNSPDDSQNTKLSMQDSCLEDAKSKFEGENSSTLLSSGGESCESPWPDPVNLSAAVRAVVQEQVDSNEEIISHPISSTSQIMNFLDCSSIHGEASEQTPSSSVEDIIEESNDGNSILDLRTMSGEVNTDPDITGENICETQEKTVQDILQLNKWTADHLQSESQRDSSVAESTSTASSESSEPSSTDCNVTSDSGVESSQEPMNLACIREEDDNVSAELMDSISEVNSVGVSDPFNNALVAKADEKLARRRGLKRLKREVEMPFEELQGEDSDDGTLSPPLPPQPRTFNDGDLVWGQIRGFPSWPGKLVRKDEVKGTQKSEDGKLWVRWFGDHTFTQVDPEKLKTLSEGLEAHHRARKRHRRGRKMNTQLENAIQEAMLELDRQSADMLTDDLDVDLDLGEGDGSLTDCMSPHRTSRTRGGYKRR